MKIFIDSANPDEIKKLYSTGLIDGVTTNPSLIAKSGRDVKEVIKEICSIAKNEVEFDVSAEVFAEDFEGMIREGEILYGISTNIVLKLPLTEDGLRACKYFSSRGLKTNITLCFSANQALLAAKAGATYISPFVGRLDDIGENGLDLIRDIKAIYSNYPALKTQILAASIRNVTHFKESALAGADAITIPPKLMHELYRHELTDKGLDIFRNDIKSINKGIQAD